MEFEKDPKKRFKPFFPDDKRPAHLPKLWCGKIQGLCDGTRCVSCHLFPNMGSEELSTERSSLIAANSMTDHECVGMTREHEE